MQTAPLQLTPEQREALLDHPGQPVHITDRETRKVYLLLEQGTLPELEADYIREGLELARTQIARGQISTTSISDIIERAKKGQTH